MNIFRNVRNFSADVTSEFKRVSWPTRQATLQSTGVVLVLTIAVAIFLGVVDVGLSSAVKMIIR
ncbi:MAG: preprotein translocase subunit SecE [SAR324 cluster bacterium]|nr:preprotein translocase subunit SecE [SAR324 cluster bacterium]